MELIRTRRVNPPTFGPHTASRRWWSQPAVIPPTLAIVSVLRCECPSKRGNFVSTMSLADT